MKLFLTLAALACMVEVTQVYGQVFVKAQADLTLDDCLCQCSSQTFTISKGRNRGVYGNCQRADATGADWCYIEPLSKTIAKARSQCNRYRTRGGSSSNRNSNRNTAFAQAQTSTTCPRGDYKESERYRGTLYSYHACTTPRLTGSVCQRLIAEAVCGVYYNNNNNNNNGFNNNNNGFNNNNNNGFNNNNNNNNGFNPGFSIGGRIAGDNSDEGVSEEAAPDSGILFGGVGASNAAPASVSDVDDDSDAVIF